jgi:hypothetical protein
MRACGFERVEHVLDRDLHVLREHLHRRRATVLGGQPVVDLLDLDRKLLGAPRHVYGPSEITEIALELAQDRRHGERREGGPSVGVVAVDRFDQAETGHLQQIVERLPGAAVAARQLAGQRQKAVDELLPRAWVTLPLPALEQQFSVGAGGGVLGADAGGVPDGCG